MAFDVLPLAVAILIAVPALGSCMGIGIAASHFLQGTARQPEPGARLKTPFFLAVGVLDGAFIIATGIGLGFITGDPFGG